MAKPGPKPLEERNPEKAREALMAFTQDGGSVQSVARKTGLPYMTASRLKQRNEGVIKEYGDRKWESLLPELKEMAAEAVKQARSALPKASSKDAMIAAGIAIEKAFLVEGRPTHNISVVHEHRHSVPAVLEAIRQELARRQGEATLDTAIEAECLEG